MNKCIICNEETKNKIYCSMKCRDINRHNKCRITLYCKTCSKEILCYSKRKKIYCSIICAAQNEELNNKKIQSFKNTCNKKYGKSHFTKTEKFKKEQKDRYIKKYGVDSFFKTKEFKKKFKKTMFSRYGVNYAQQCNKIKEKTKKSVIEKYGGFTYQVDSKIKLVKKTLMDKYGVDSPLKSEIIKNKVKKTNLKLYGSAWGLGNKEIQNKIKKTLKEKYNVENISQIAEINNKNKDIARFKMYNSMVSGSRLNNCVTALFDFSNYSGVGYYTKYKFKCSTCNKEFEDHIKSGHIPQCQECFPKNLPYSNEEMELYEYIKLFIPESNIIRNSKSILPSGKELDIYIPSKNLAIEYNGLYWHSEISGNKDKLYHISKTDECNLLNIQLIHIFSDEWYNSKDIVKNRIRHILQFDKENTTYARNCTLAEISSKQKNVFLKQNHLQGSDNSSIKIGAYNSGELVAVMTFSKPRIALGRKNKTISINEYELTRFATSKNVIGISSKLLSYFIKKYIPSKIISYADRRWSTGNLYKVLGFKLISATKPNYWYTSDHINKIHRFNFRKNVLNKKLEIFDSNLTEWENMKLNKYDRIWDCGSLKYELVV